MSLLGNLFTQPGATSQVLPGGGSASVSGSGLQMLLDGLRGDAGVVVSQSSALGMPAVWRAVNLVAGTLASLPLGPYRVSGSVREQVTAGPAFELVHNPHPDLTKFEFWELMLSHLLLWGNSYALRLPGPSGFTEKLWPIHPARVTPGRVNDKSQSKVYMLDQKMDRGYTDAEIFHVPGFGYDGIAGLSAIGAGREGIGLALAAEKYGAALFGGGSLASGILKTDRRLTSTQAADLKERWQATQGGLDHAHEVAVLDSGLSFQQLSIPPEDAQFIESRTFQIEEIARLFGVPPHLLMQTDKTSSWGAGIEQQGIGFVVYTLRPWIARLEQRLSKLTTEIDPSIKAHYSVEGLLRGDTGARYAAYSIARNGGWLSVNDIRALEELPPIDGGDQYLSPLNMTPVSDADQAAIPATESGSTE